MIAFKGGRMSAAGKRSGLGSGFGSLISYLKHGRADALPNPERVAWVSYRNLDGIDDPVLAGRLMRAYAEENPRVERPVYHFGLSLAPGEHLTPEQWDVAVDRVLERLGLAEHQAVVMAHRDTEREHVHVVVNRVGEDGRAWDPKRDLVKAYEAVHEIEAEQGLHRTGEPTLAPPDLSQGAHQEARRTGRQPLVDRVRAEAGPDLARAASWRDLDQALAARGLRLESAERGSGVVVSDGVRRVSLSHVDRNLSGPKLAERFGETFREYRAHDPEPPLFGEAPRAADARGDGVALAERAASLVQGVSATQATFTEGDLQRAAFYEPDREELVREALKPQHMLEVGAVRGVPRYTTREYLEAEVRLFEKAERLAGRSELRLDPSGVERVLESAAGFRLSDEQRAAVFHATTHGDLAQIVGRAGAGKTTTARTIAEAYREQGYEVQGAALAGKAAEGLQEETGIPSRTLASWEWAWSEGRDRLHAGSVLVVDEAGMIDTRQLGRVLEEAEQAGAKVVLLGDPDQLKAIGAGDAYRGLLERHTHTVLETIRRQAEPWQREASEELARGAVPEALNRYEAAGRLHWAASREEAHSQLVARYLEDRKTAPETSQLILAYRNEEVRQLNEEVRAGRAAAGELAGPAVSVGKAEYAEGDRVVFLKNDNAGREVANVDPAASSTGVKNGTLGTVEVAEPGRLVVRLDEGRRVAFDPERCSLAHGYAVTVHKSQGATVDRLYALADPSMDRHTTYVALTRHRETVDLYIDRESFPDRPHLDRALSRGHQKDLAQDYGYGAAQLGELAAREAVRATEAEAEPGRHPAGEPRLAPPDLPQGAHEEARRTGGHPLAERVRAEAGPELARAASWRDLDEALAARGLRLENAERGSGVAVSDGIRQVSLSQVDRSLSGPKLAERFGETFHEYRAHTPEPPLFQQEPGALAPAAPGPPDEVVLSERADALVQGVSATRATFTEADLQRAAFFEPDRAELVREALKPQHSLEVGEYLGVSRYTTREYLESEVRLFEKAERLAARSGLRLDPSGVERALDSAAGARLSEEQRAAVFHATTHGDLAQIVGRAGAGKTTVARTIAEAYREQGYEVQGAALAGKAAEGLQQEAGIPSRTLASLERAWTEGRDRLHGGSVLVVDEAGMIDTRHLGRVLEEADRAGAKVVLLGDPDQLKAIGAGDAYRGLLERHAHAYLETIRRQAEPWQREASEELAGGAIPQALDRYEAAGRLHWADTREEARAQLVARYLEDRKAAPESSQLIVTYRNEDVRQLNEEVRAGRAAAGELAGPAVPVGKAEYTAGDRVVFLKNDNAGRDVANVDPAAPSTGVKNGTLGTVEAVEPGRLVVRLDEGRRVAFDPERYSSIAHGYAVTVHKSQGATVDRVYTLADPSMNRHAIYVALTRHREAVDLYIDRKSFEDRAKLDKVLSRASQKDLAQDYGAAELGRVAARARSFEEQSKALRREEQSLKAELATRGRVAQASRELHVAHHGVAQAAGRIYANPQEATKALLADPKALDRLAAGEAGAYGQIRGQERFLLGKDAVRTQAEREVPNLRTAIWNFRETQARLERQESALSRIGNSLPEVRQLLDRVSATLHRPFEALAQGPERAARAAQSLPDRLLPKSEARETELEGTRAAVQKAAGRIFLDPREATRAILADPRALDRLARGETQAYGELNYKARDLGSDGRPKAEHALPVLSAAVRAHHEAERGGSRPTSPSPGAPLGAALGRAQEVQALLDRVTSTLRQVQTLSRGPEQALELAVRTTSRAAVQATLALLPSPVQTPVRLLLRAAERTLDLGRELGRELGR